MHDKTAFYSQANMRFFACAQKDKKNPGEPGYGGSTTGGTFGEKGYPSGGANACLAAPCTGRGRSGRPVFVRAAAAQVFAAVLVGDVQAP